MRIGSPATYECPKGKNGLHCWKFSVWEIATCVRCNLILSKEDTADLRQSNERSQRELDRL